MDAISTRRPVYDLEERTRLFAGKVRSFLLKLPKVYLLQDDAEQLVRSSGSVAANYIEANEALSKKDALTRMKICRKESKESELWLDLLRVPSPELEAERALLAKEAHELRLIFSTIIQKFQSP